MRCTKCNKIHKKKHMSKENYLKMFFNKKTIRYKIKKGKTIIKDRKFIRIGPCCWDEYKLEDITIPEVIKLDNPRGDKQFISTNNDI